MIVFDMEVGRVESFRFIEEPYVRPEPPAYERELRPSRLNKLTKASRLNKLTKALHDADSRLVGPVALSENGTYGAKCFIWRSE